MPNQDPTLTLLIEGITATAELLGAKDDDSRTTAEASWSTFEDKLRATPEATPLGQLAERFRLNTFELRCVLLGLASHIEPRMSTVVASTRKDSKLRSARAAGRGAAGRCAGRVVALCCASRRRPSQSPR